MCACSKFTCDPSVMVSVKPDPVGREGTASLQTRKELLEYRGMLFPQNSRMTSCQLPPSSLLWTTSDPKRSGNVHALIKATENY